MDAQFELKERREANDFANQEFNRVKKAKLENERAKSRARSKKLDEKAEKQLDRERANRASAAASRAKIVCYARELEKRTDRLELDRNHKRKRADQAIKKLEILREETRKLKKVLRDIWELKDPKTCAYLVDSNALFLLGSRVEEEGGPDEFVDTPPVPETISNLPPLVDTEALFEGACSSRKRKVTLRSTATSPLHADIQDPSHGQDTTLLGSQSGPALARQSLPPDTSQRRNPELLSSKEDQLDNPEHIEQSRPSQNSIGERGSLGYVGSFASRPEQREYRGSEVPTPRSLNAPSSSQQIMTLEQPSHDHSGPILQPGIFSRQHSSLSTSSPSGTLASQAPRPVSNSITKGQSRDGNRSSWRPPPVQSSFQGSLSRLPAMPNAYFAQSNLGPRESLSQRESISSSQQAPKLQLPSFHLSVPSSANLMNSDISARSRIKEYSPLPPNPGQSAPPRIKLDPNTPPNIHTRQQSIISECHYQPQRIHTGASSWNERGTIQAISDTRSPPTVAQLRSTPVNSAFRLPPPPALLPSALPSNLNRSTHL